MSKGEMVEEIMNYAERDITKRAEQSPLWPRLSNQDGATLPYLLERYLLLENWKYQSRFDDSIGNHPSIHDVQFLHLLLAEAATVLLSHEERLRRLESNSPKPEDDKARRVTEIFNALRFDKDTHLGEGKIALDAATQNKILEIISK